MNDAISTRKIPKNTRLCLMFSLGIFLVEMTSFVFLSQHRDTQAIFYLLNTALFLVYRVMSSDEVARQRDESLVVNKLALFIPQILLCTVRRSMNKRIKAVFNVVFMFAAKNRKHFPMARS